MPKILYPKITGPLSSLVEKYSPTCDDHLHCAIHEAGHYAATINYRYSSFRYCYVYDKSNKGDFVGGQYSGWAPEPTTPHFEYLEGLTLQFLGGVAAELAVQKVHGARAVNRWAAIEAKAAVEGFKRYATPEQYAETTRKLGRLFEAPSVQFQQAFARMLMPAKVGRKGINPPGKPSHHRYYGAGISTSWQEWINHLHDCKVTYCKTWEQFVAEWKISPIPSPPPIDTAREREVLNYYRRNYEEDVRASEIETGRWPGHCY